MIRIREDIANTVRDYCELEGKIISVCKKLEIIRKETDYLGFFYDEKENKITVRVRDYTDEFGNTRDYTFDDTCIFCNASIKEAKALILKEWNESK